MKNLFKHLNKIRSGLFIIMVVPALFLSCNELDEDPSVANLAPGKFTNKEELDLAVTGLYARLRAAAEFTTFEAASWAGDDITTHPASNKADFREFDQRAVSNLNSRNANNWRDIYAMIRSANNIIANVDLISGPEVDNLVGQGHFMRAFMYMKLTRVHGRIPLQLEPLPNNNLPLSSHIEIYSQIESDFKKAIDLLPNIQSNINEGAVRPNKGSAKAFLARLYMDWAGYPVKDNSKYALAAQFAKEVIDNKASHGFELLSDINDLWKLSNRFNKESIFTIAHCQTCGLFNRKFSQVALTGIAKSWTETLGEIKFFEDFPEGPRKDATYITSFTVDDNNVYTTDPAKITKTLKWEDAGGVATPVFRKLALLDDINPPTWQNGMNDYVMRYAEVLLIYSEASGRSGAVTADAWEALNKVRRRAEGLDPFVPSATADVTSGDIAELSYTERKWEFAGEYIRWNDLVRMERVEQVLSDRAPKVSTKSDGNLLQVTNPILGSLKTTNYFSPIPQSEVELNPNLEN